MSFTQQFSVNYGQENTGFGASIAFALPDPATITPTTPITPTSQSAVAEYPSGSGIYHCTATFPAGTVGIATWSPVGFVANNANEDIGESMAALVPSDPANNADVWGSFSGALGGILHALNLGGRKTNTGTTAAGTQVVYNLATPPVAIATSTWTNTGGVFDKEAAT